MCHCIYIFFLYFWIASCKRLISFVSRSKTKAEFRHGLSGANAREAGPTMSHTYMPTHVPRIVHTLNTVDSYKCLYGKVSKVPGEIFNWFSLQIFRFELESKKGLKT